MTTSPSPFSFSYCFPLQDRVWRAFMSPSGAFYVNTSSPSCSSYRLLRLPLTPLITSFFYCLGSRRIGFAIIIQTITPTASPTLSSWNLLGHSSISTFLFPCCRYHIFFWFSLVGVIAIGTTIQPITVIRIGPRSSPA